MSLAPHLRRFRPGSGSLRPAPLAALLVVVLTACGGEDGEPTQPPPTALSAITAVPEPETPPASAASPADPASPAAGAASPGASPGVVPTPITAITLTPGAEVTAEQALRFGAGRIANLGSAHFRATIDGTVYIDDERTLQLVSAEGNVVRPGRAQTQFRIRVGDQAISDIRLISIGDDAWMTDIISGDWVPAPAEFGYDPGILFDAENGLAPVMLGVENPVLTGTEEIDGRTAYVIEATANEELVGPITAHTLTGYPVTVRAWIDQERGNLLRIVLIEAPSPETDDPATWTLELSRFDVDITIEPPEIDG